MTLDGTVEDDTGIASGGVNMGSKLGDMSMYAGVRNKWNTLSEMVVWNERQNEWLGTSRPNYEEEWFFESRVVGLKYQKSGQNNCAVYLRSPVVGATKISSKDHLLRKHSIKRSLLLMTSI